MNGISSICGSDKKCMQNFYWKSDVRPLWRCRSEENIYTYPSDSFV